MQRLNYILLFICLSLLCYVVYIQFVSHSSNCRGQLVFPIVGVYNGKSAQGMAIWHDCAYLFNDGGHCRVLNLKNGKIVNEFDLSSSNKNTHVNSACFIHSKDDNNQPLLYITEFNKPSRCFVECLTENSSKLVQVIKVQNKGKDAFIQTWIVDEYNSFLYSVTRMSPPKGEKFTKKVRICKFRLPLLSEGYNIILSEEDCLDSFIAEFASGTQGGKIRGKYMFLASGLQAAAHGQFNAQRAIQVIDLTQKKKVKSIDLTYVTTNEPEDLDFYNNKCLLYCGQQGGIYELNIEYYERNDTERTSNSKS